MGALPGLGRAVLPVMIPGSYHIKKRCSSLRFGSAIRRMSGRPETWRQIDRNRKSHLMIGCVEAISASVCSTASTNAASFSGSSRPLVRTPEHRSSP